MEHNSRVKFVETLQILRRNPKLREHERQKIIEFLNSEKSKSEVCEANSRFEKELKERVQREQKQQAELELAKQKIQVKEIPIEQENNQSTVSTLDKPHYKNRDENRSPSPADRILGKRNDRGSI